MSETYLEQAPCLYFLTTDSGVLLEVNEPLCRMLNYGRHELEGNKAELFFTVPTKIFYQTHFFPLLKMKGHAEEIFISLKKRDGEELPVLINAERKTIGDRAVNLHLGIIVYNRKKFEDELIAAKKWAEAALNENTELAEAKNQLQKRSEELDRQLFLVNQQNEELKQLNRVATHDLQEPLRKLLIFSNMLIEDSRQHDQKGLIDKIKRITGQMKDIISGLQQYVWLSDTLPDGTSIDLPKMLLLVRQQLEKDHPGIQLLVETGSIQSFTADREQMYLLFHELLLNAIRFRKEDAKVVVHVSADTLQLNQFRELKEKYKYVDYLRIQVKDEGVGFDPESSTDAFGLFKRLHTQSGRGVGLSLCKKIMDNHHGTISIDGKTGEGATVTILMPLAFTVAGSGEEQKTGTDEIVKENE